MQSIAALAHLKSCVLDFMDLSEQCGHTIEAQVFLPFFFLCRFSLFLYSFSTSSVNSSTPSNPSSPPNSPSSYSTNPTSPFYPPFPISHYRHHLQSGRRPPVTLVECSRYTEEGVVDLRNKDCDLLLAAKREAFIPDKVKEKGEKGEKMYDKEHTGRKKLLRDREIEKGDAGGFNINLKGFNDTDPEESDFDSLDETRVTEKSRSARLNSQATKKSLKNHAKLPRTAGLRTLSELSEGLTKAGYDPSRIREREGLAKVVGEKRKRAGREEREREADVEMEDVEGAWEDDDGDMDVEMEDGDEAPRLKRTKGNSGGVVAVGGGKRVPRTNRAMDGLRDGEQAIKATKLRDFGKRPRNMLARAGEGDRAIKTKMPKHLFAGKRKAGKTSRR
ncbi:hypothetical protein K435DRAFT_879325 [Dendrothele bispora CBS 962.96]|uniref:Nucleolar GTP-binding protein 1 Rossman-fold domain-containing protein n=1 Tax=Dendrothele bispora (strain CBS 962.96) TaxID=1314807 RepID=A0A4S8KLF7_DENBC|nr:hypothetical protein K435DRAFT_879325 [Dendrothele bispora CBS 962.96]